MDLLGVRTTAFSQNFIILKPNTIFLVFCNWENIRHYRNCLFFAVACEIYTIVLSYNLSSFLILAFYNLAAAIGGQFNLNRLSGGSKIQVLTQSLNAYGFARPYVDNYLSPRVDCGPEDFERLLDEFKFLEYPDPSTHRSVLRYYVTEFNHLSKKRLYCLVSKTKKQDCALGSR